MSLLTPRVAHLKQKLVLQISGPDSQKFLKGLSCKDVEYLSGGYSGFLNASGRVLHTVFIFPRSDTSYLITHESQESHPEPLTKLLPPFKLRSKVRIKDVTDQWDAWSSWGSSLAQIDSPRRLWKIGSGGAAESHWEWQQGVAQLNLAEGEVGCWDLRAGWNGMSQQLLVPKGNRPSLATNYDISTADEYKLHRMLLGVPEGPEEIVPGQALPLESCMDIHGGVDFRKGCYLGQELTVRTYHTGATRKRILPIHLIPLDSTLKIFDVLNSPVQTPIEDGNILSEIIYHPPRSSATRKTRSIGKVLALHNTTIFCSHLSHNG
nr:mitochondrial protein [Cryptococcus depauperatus CBS 7841]